MVLGQANVSSASLPVFSFRPAVASLWASVCPVKGEWWLDEAWCLALCCGPAWTQHLWERTAGAQVRGCMQLMPGLPAKAHVRFPAGPARQLVSGKGGRQGRKWNLGHQPCSLAGSASLWDWKVSRARTRDYSDLWEASREKPRDLANFPKPAQVTSAENRIKRAQVQGCRWKQGKVGSTCPGQARLFLAGTLHRCFFFQLLQGISRI